MTFPFPMLNTMLAGYSAIFSYYALGLGTGADVVDSASLHTSGTFTIPASWNGRKARVGGGQFFEGNAANTLTTTKGGGSYEGSASNTFPVITGNEEGASVHGAPVIVSTGDTFSVSGIQNSNNGNWRYIELLPSGVRGALVNLITSAFALTGGSFNIPNWNNEVYDDGAWHDNTTNPNRLTQPSGGTGLARLSLSLKTTGAGTELLARIRKNGSVLTGMVADTVGNNLSIMSPPVAMTTGDYFDIQINPTSSTNLEVSDNSWMAVEELDSSLQYAVAATNTSRAIPSGAVWTAWTANVENADVGGWFSPSDTKFTVPAGVTRVRMGFFMVSSNSLGSTWCGAMKKNGGNDFAGMPYASQSNPGVENIHAVSGIIDCVAGDTFEFYAKTSAGSMNVASGSFCWIEEVPTILS